MSQIVIYPRYYVSVMQAAGEDVRSPGDAEVTELYAMYMSQSSARASWTFQAHVAEVALRLFGASFKQWLTYQQDNFKIAGMNLEFLNDTLRFIEGGERQVSLFGWIELLSELGDGNATQFRNPVSGLRPFEIASTAQVIQAWCRRPHGLDDLVVTLNVLFGKARHSAT